MPSRFRFGLVVGLIILTGCGSAAVPTVEVPQSPSPKLRSAPTPAPSPSPSVASPSPAAEATVPIDWTTYKSKRYSYSIDYPSDWIASPATVDWPATGNTYPDDQAIDKWSLPPTEPKWVLMFVSSVALQPGEAAAERIAKLDADNAAACNLSNRRKVVVDGEAARREDGMCFGSDFISQVAVVKGGRFYFIYVLSGFPLTDTVMATFDHFLASFRFGRQ